MLIDSIIHAQQGCDSDMMFLVSKFSGILKKYARKLNYEDAEQDLTADFIELIHHIDIEKLNNTSDGAIVNFLIRSTYHYYVNRVCTQALIYAYQNRRAIIDDRMVQIVLEGEVA